MVAPSPAQNYGESTKPIEIDESEEFERMTLLKQRETLIRGMGVTDMCHRILSGTPGTTANLPIANNTNTTMNGLQHNAQTDIADPSQNLSLLQYVGSKLPNSQLNRYTTTNGVSTQGLQQYFTSQQHSMQPKYDIRSTKNGTTTTHNGARLSRYQQVLRASDNNLPQTTANRVILPTHIMPQITTNFSPKTTIGTTNSALDPSVRTKSANTVPRNRAGGLYLVSCGSNVTRLPSKDGNIARSHEIAVNGSSMPVGNKLQSLCDYSSFEQQFQRFHVAKLSTNDNNIRASTSSSVPK